MCGMQLKQKLWQTTVITLLCAFGWGISHYHILATKRIDAYNSLQTTITKAEQQYKYVHIIYTSYNVYQSNLTAKVCTVVTLVARSCS